MNKIVGYRNMLGMTQEKNGKTIWYFSSSVTNERETEINFNKEEMIVFRNLLRKDLIPNITIDEIILNAYYVLLWIMKKGYKMSHTKL